MEEEEGRPLIEVFSISIKSFEGDYCILFGTVEIADGIGSISLYDRKKENPEFLSSGSTITLQSPPRYISAYGSHTISISLMKTSKDLTYEEFCNGSISWNVYDVSNIYNSLLVETMDGVNGSVSIYYAVFSEATLARVEASFGSIERSSSCICGVLAAGNTRIDSVEREIFCRKDKEEVYLDCDGGVLLSKCFVAVPLDSSLRIRAHLWVCDGDAPNGEQMVQGVVAFPAQTSGEAEEIIAGELCSVRIKITWQA